MKKIMRVFAPSVIALFLFASVASAHVVVYPKETVQGTYQVFTVQVPSENEKIPTTKIEVKFPEGVDVTRFMPKPGWKYDLTKDATGKITAVTWTATAGGLTPTEFGQFLMQGKVADDAKELKWKAYQTYKDGSVVEWVGAEGSDKPASVTLVNPKENTVQKPNASTTSGPSNAPLYLSIAALIVGLLSLFVSFRKK